MLGLCAMPLLITKRYWQQPEIPRVVLLPIGLMLLVLVQFGVGKIEYFSQTLLVALYLLWAALLVMLGQRLREEFGLPLLVTVLAAFLLLGAELNTLAGVIQHFNWHTFLGHLVLRNSGGLYGNMGQPNHFADYVSLGLISLGLLHSRWQLRAWQVALFAAPMLFVLVLSGSRSVWLYLLCFAVMAFFWRGREKKGDAGNPSAVSRHADKSNRLLLHYSLSLLLGFALMHFVVQIPWLAGHGGETTFGRIADAVEGEGGWKHSVRLQIWYEAWLIFAKFPFLGAGFGQFGWQHFLLGPSQQNPLILGLYNNAHNLVMQTAAEMGLAGLLIWLCTLVLWIRQALNAPRTIYHWWAGGVLAVLAIHSLLEYPLWYAYFIGVAALTLGMLDSTTYRLELRNVGRLSVASILLLGVLSLAQVWQGYRVLESLMAPRQASVASNEEFFKELLQTYRQALLQPFVEVTISGLMEGRVENLEDMRALNESVMHFAPIGSVVYREVTLLAISGESAAAQSQLGCAIWAYPGEYPKYLEQWRAFAQKDPAHFAALLEFAPKKYEEYQLAVHAK